MMLSILYVYLFFLIPSILLGFAVFDELLRDAIRVKSLKKVMSKGDFCLFLFICLGSFVSIVLVVFAFVVLVAYSQIRKYHH